MPVQPAAGGKRDCELLYALAPGSSGDNWLRCRSVDDRVQRFEQATYPQATPQPHRQTTCWNVVDSVPWSNVSPQLSELYTCRTSGCEKCGWSYGTCLERDSAPHQ